MWPHWTDVTGFALGAVQGLLWPHWTGFIGSSLSGVQGLLWPHWTGVTGSAPSGVQELRHFVFLSLWNEDITSASMFGARITWTHEEPLEQTLALGAQ